MPRITPSASALHASKPRPSLDAVLSAPGPSSQAETLDAMLRSYIGDSESDADCEADSDSDVIALDGAPGDKRKLFVFTPGCELCIQCS